jgi:MerR family transcriptional regulator, light-induced transcriptional regulator
VDKSGQTISATRFAQLTGVSRERLRTWERRYGFPTPHRVARGPRRYAADDVSRVVAVRHAAAAGVPLAAAIARTQAAEAAAAPPAETLASLVDGLPVPVVALSGPAPLRIEYVNAALRELPDAPGPGDELVEAVPAFAGAPCERALLRLFATDAGAVEAHHPAWGGHARNVARSSLFRLPAAPGAPPLVAMLGLEGDGERAARAALAAQRRELDALRHSHARNARWLEALGLLAEALQREPEPAAAIEQSLDVLVRQTLAADAGLAAYAAGRLGLDRSHRGTFGPEAVTVAAHPQLAAALRSGDPAWLEAAERAAFGVPEDLRACGVPVVVAAEPLGMLVLAAEEPEPLDAESRRLLRSISAAMGFVLLRDRLVADLREAAAAGGRLAPARGPVVDAGAGDGA